MLCIQEHVHVLFCFICSSTCIAWCTIHVLCINMQLFIGMIPYQFRDNLTVSPSFSKRSAGRENNGFDDEYPEDVSPIASGRSRGKSRSRSKHRVEGEKI